MKLLLLTLTVVTSLRSTKPDSSNAQRTPRSSEVNADMLRVREAMSHIWKGYKAKAYGADEIKPSSGKAVTSSWGGIGLTLLDSLDTLWLLGMKDEFDEAEAWVKDHYSIGEGPASRGEVSFFELTIRALGGLISAYDLSGRETFKIAARKTGEFLLKCFRPDGSISARINVGTGVVSDGWGESIAGAGSNLLEFRALTRITGDPKFAQVAEKTEKMLLGLVEDNGITGAVLYNSQLLGALTIAGGADSYYEYLLKLWLQSGKQDEEYKKAWVSFANKLPEISRVASVGSNSSRFYIADDIQSPVQTMNHLSCFVGANLILGSFSMPNEERSRQWSETASRVTDTCMGLYDESKSGLGPETVSFNPYYLANPVSLLRPEAVESAYYMHYFTEDEKYVEWGRRFLDSLNKNSRTDFGYSGLKDVNGFQKNDEMQSFFPAETIKYLYLLFAPRETLSMGEWVFNTEAHPFRIFN